MGVSRTRSARRNTCKWRGTVGWGRSSTAWISETKSGAAARQFRIRSRVGSATVRSRSAAEPEMAEVVICAQTNIWEKGTNGNEPLEHVLRMPYETGSVLHG